MEQKIYIIWHGFVGTKLGFLCPRAEALRQRKPFSACKSMPDCLFELFPAGHHTLCVDSCFNCFLWATTLSVWILVSTVSCGPPHCVDFMVINLRECRVRVWVDITRSFLRAESILCVTPHSGGISANVTHIFLTWFSQDNFPTNLWERSVRVDIMVDIVPVHRSVLYMPLPVLVEILQNHNLLGRCQVHL